MTYVGAIKEILSQLIELEEERFVAGYHKNIEKERLKIWHGRHIKKKKF